MEAFGTGITGSAEDGSPMALRGTQQMRYGLLAANCSAIEKTVMTETLGSD